MQDIPIFDSLTHPTVDGNWLMSSSVKTNSVEHLRQEMQENNVKWAFAVGMGSPTQPLHAQSYIDLVKPYQPSLYAVAFFDPQLAHHGLKGYLQSLKTMGFIGIKIHPRLARLSYLDPLVVEAVKYAAELNLIVLICTYTFSAEQSSVDNDLKALHQLLIYGLNTHMILLHGGVTQLLHVAEMIKSFPKTILDLSYTLCKFAGSSLDLDISYLFRSFDRRICVGSDSPEYSLQKMRNRFEHFAIDLARDKQENIAYKNLLQWVSIA